jgi:hypothetical protein
VAIRGNSGAARIASNGCGARTYCDYTVCRWFRAAGMEPTKHR